jgi:hypothetical protein
MLRSAALATLLSVSGCAAADLSPSTERGGVVRVASRADAGSSDAPSPDAGLDGGGTDAPEPAVVVFEAPTDGARFVRDRIVGAEWAAAVRFVVRASGVDEVEFVADGTFSLGAARADGTGRAELAHEFFVDGARRIAAIGRDAAGAERVRAEVSIVIAPPADTSCHAMLDALGLDWAVAGASRGIADPVRVQPFIEGVRFRYVSSAEPTSMLMDCELAPRLVQLAQLVRPYGIDEVIHIGIYNYRCIGGGDPDVDGCTPSQHAYARAIDLHAFGLEGSDLEYSTETDFEITGRGDDCPLDPYANDADRVLKEVACSLWSDGIFQIVLTPNYNAAHRNHYHVDMTEGSMFLGAAAAGVDPPVPGLGD